MKNEIGWEKENERLVGIDNKRPILRSFERGETNST